MKAGMNTFNMHVRLPLARAAHKANDLYRIADTDIERAVKQLELEIRDRLDYAEEIIDSGTAIGIREKDEAFGRRDAFSRILDRGKFLGLFGNKK